MADAKVSPTNFQLFIFKFIFKGPLEKRQFAQASTELATVNECLVPCSICLSSLDVSKQMKYDIV